MTDDATIAVGEDLVPAGRLPADGARKRFGAVTIESLRTPTRRLDVEIVDATTGDVMPARVRFRAADGRYLPPMGHRDEINPGLNEDTGADLVLGAATYAYVPGRFPIELPEGAVQVEVVRGFGYRPLSRSIEVGADGNGDRSRAPLVLALESVAGPAGPDWITVDCHVHFISPTSALLQARAEGVAIVNLLATQWGDHHTSGADLPAAVVTDPTGRHMVVMGSENRQNMLGHIGLLGASDAVLPMASAGAPEARLGDPLTGLIADWADAAREQGGLALAVHFPLPYGEVAADIVSGKIDAVEMQALTPDIDGPSIREWYRFLNCGFRLPIVGGTDKMSAEIPLGAVRTYARLDPGAPISFETWAAAVRAGRTFVSSGSFVDLEVDGCGPGDVITLGRSGGSVEVRAAASAAQPVIDRLELIRDGVVIAATTAGGSDRASLAERVTISKGGWLAARVTSREQIHSGFATSMGAHSSPVYVDIPGKPAFAPDDAAAIGTIIDGARTWVEQIATVRSPGGTGAAGRLHGRESGEARRPRPGALAPLTLDDRPDLLERLAERLGTDRRVATVHQQLGTGDERRTVRQQERHRVGHFLGIRHPAERLELRSQGVGPFPCAVAPLDIAAPHPAGRDRVDADAARGEVVRRALDEHQQRRLGHVVHDVGRLGDMSAHRGDVNDRAARGHRRGSLRREHRGRPDVGVEDAVPQLARAAEELVLEVCGDPDHAIEPSVLVERGRDEPVQVGILGHIRRHETRRVGQTPRRGRSVVRIAVTQDHAGAGGHQVGGDRLAHEGCGARDHDHPVVEVAHRRQTPTRWRCFLAAQSSRAARTAARSLTSGTPTSHQAPPSVQVYSLTGMTMT